MSRGFQLTVWTFLIVGAAIFASALVRAHYQPQLMANRRIIAQQLEELTSLRSAKPKASNVEASGLQESPNTTGSMTSQEIADLRMKVTMLRTRIADLQTTISNSGTPGTTFFAAGDYNILNHNKEIGATLAGGPRPVDGKLSDARSLATAISKFAHDHGGTFPQNLDQAAPFFPKPLAADAPGWQDAPISGTNRFELVFQGNLNDLTNIPRRRVAILREQESWQDAEGRTSRTYGYADGSATIVISDDQFHSWDAQHIIPSDTSRSQSY